MNDTISATGETPPLCSVLQEETTTITPASLPEEMSTPVAVSSKESTLSTQEGHYTSERITSQYTTELLHASSGKT